MNDERFDVLDEHGGIIGTATRAEVHARGLWHRTFHCWIWRRENADRKLLFQLRHPDKDTFPGLLDASCAGHLLAGEAPRDGIRELKEELGLEVDFAALRACGVFREVDVISEQFIDREHCHVYVLEDERPLTDYRMQREEVSGLYWIGLDDLQRLLQEGGTAGAEGIARASDGTVSPSGRQVGKDDFVPHPIEYYRLVFQAMEGCL